MHKYHDACTPLHSKYTSSYIIVCCYVLLVTMPLLRGPLAVYMQHELNGLRDIHAPRINLSKGTKADKMGADAIEDRQPTCPDQGSSVQSMPSIAARLRASCTCVPENGT